MMLTQKMIRIMKLAYDWRPLPMWDIKHMVGARPGTEAEEGKVYATLATCCQARTPELTDAHRVHIDLDAEAIRLIEDTAAAHRDVGCTARTEPTDALAVLSGRYTWGYDK